jgi:hypothetical protein
MSQAVVLHIEFPTKEFNLMPSAFVGDFSLRHRAGKNLFYLGEVVSVYRENPKKVIMSLEIRKDETPAWYVRDIVKKAQQEEIVIMNDSKIICKDGRLRNTENLNERLDADTVVSVEAWITPK